eukprot:COSAG03_NODE_1508_length_3959_cov_27.988601_6_plen_192_part_00
MRARKRGGKSGGRASSAGGGGLGGAAGMLTMRRLQAPARHEPDIDQHQRRALCALIRETGSYVQKRTATQPLRGRFRTGPRPRPVPLGCHQQLGVAASCPSSQGVPVPRPSPCAGHHCWLPRLGASYPASGSCVLEQRLLPTGLFFLGVQGRRTPRKNSPVARCARMSTCEVRAGGAARGAPRRGRRPLFI